MPKLAIAIIASLAAGFALAGWVIRAPDTVAPAAERADSGFNQGAGIEQRLAALESAVNAEREARQLLEEEILILYEELETLESADGVAPQGGVAAAVADDRRVVQRFANSRFGTGDDVDGRLQALTGAGFSQPRAEWIIQRESELRMEAMQARYDAIRSGEALDRFDPSLNPDQLLRDEIGDNEYESYLQAYGRETTIGVDRIMESSPAASAGLQAGDQVTHYDGVRVFNVNDLTRQTMHGEPGESVVVNIVRDGTPMQVALPRGPLGINARRGR